MQWTGGNTIAGEHQRQIFTYYVGMYDEIARHRDYSIGQETPRN
jgi:hypothetical protein